MINRIIPHPNILHPRLKHSDLDLDHLRKYNLQLFGSPDDVVRHVQRNRTDLGGLSHIVTADGYTNPPDTYKEDFGEMVYDFLFLLACQLGGKGHIGLVAAPSTNKEYSVDFIATRLVHNLGLPVVYLTGGKYWTSEYINADLLTDGVDPSKYMSHEKYIVPKIEDSLEAGSSLSTSLVLFGGRSITLSDFIYTINRGKKVVLVIDRTNQSPPHDHGRLHNTTLYLKELIVHFRKHGKFGSESLLDYQNIKRLIIDNWEFIANHVLVVEQNSKDELNDRISETITFLAG